MISAPPSAVLIDLMVGEPPHPASREARSSLTFGVRALAH